jgi:hypothetical protein
MIPPFDEIGYLPPGIHPATLDEIEDRFGKESELRRAQMQSLRWLADLAHRVGAEKMAVNGSFVSDALEPNDVDCVVLLGPDFPKDTGAAAELADGLPFIQLYLEGHKGYDYFVQQFYATDRDGVPKGMLEVML